MRKTAVVIGLLVSLTTSSPGQESKQRESKLVRAPFVGGDASHVIQEAALDLKEYARGAKDAVAIRVCSTEPMPVALSTAAASPFVMVEYLKHYGFSEERILFLRSEDCLGRNRAATVTEFWTIPEGAIPPPSIESIISSQARMEVVRTEDMIKTAKDYNVALQELADKMCAKPRVSGVVIGSYYEKPSPDLEKNLLEAKRVLGLAGVPAGRFHIRAVPVLGARESNIAEPKYPHLFIVEIAPPGL